MPELPEAETIVRGLRSELTGRTILDVTVHHADVLPGGPRGFADGVSGRRIEGTHRRGKNVVLRLDDGGVVLVNLGMTGKLLPRGRVGPRGSGAPAPTHPAVVLHLDGGVELVFDDTRRFGAVEHLGTDAWRARSTALGPEPLDPLFTPKTLWRGLRTSRAPVRSWLLDQRRIAGVGNIYAAEALFLAAVHPRRRARTLRLWETAALHGGLREVLSSAIRAGGTTIRDYRNARGGEGSYASELLVYGRENKPCPRCSTPIERVVFANRSAFLCPSCQPRRPGRRDGAS